MILKIILCSTGSQWRFKNKGAKFRNSSFFVVLSLRWICLILSQRMCVAQLLQGTLGLFLVILYLSHLMWRLCASLPFFIYILKSVLTLTAAVSKKIVRIDLSKECRFLLSCGDFKVRFRTIDYRSVIGFCLVSFPEPKHLLFKLRHTARYGDKAVWHRYFNLILFLSLLFISGITMNRLPRWVLELFGEAHAKLTLI